MPPLQIIVRFSVGDDALGVPFTPHSPPPLRGAPSRREPLIGIPYFTCRILFFRLDWADDQWSPLRFLIIFSRKTPFSHRFVGKLRVGELLRAKLKPFVGRPMVECAKCVVLGIFSYFYVKKAPDLGAFLGFLLIFLLKNGV